MAIKSGQGAIIALYDGDCVICRGARRAFLALDWRRRINFIDIHDGEAWQGPYPDLEREALMGEIHVIDDAGAVTAGIHATRRLLRETPLGLPLWALLKLPGMAWLSARAYAFVAGRRYFFNRLFGAPDRECADEGCNPRA